MSVENPDKLIVCQDGGHARFVVQRFRYLASQGVWMGSREQGMTVPLHENSRRVQPWGEETPGRWRGELVCGFHGCKETVPYRDEKLQLALMLLQEAGVHEVSLVGLRVALSSDLVNTTRARHPLS